MESNGNRRVVITGVGAITPVGHTAEETWQGMLAGKSGFSTETEQFNKSVLQVGGSCEVKDFDPAELLGRKEARRRDRYEQLAAVALQEAFEQSGLKVTDDNRENIGVFMGTGAGGIQTIIDVETTWKTKSPRRVSPFSVTMIMSNGAAGMASIDYGIQGPSLSITTACAASSDAIGYAYMHVKNGKIDAALTGGSEAPLTTTTLSGFERAGALSFRTEGTPSPFDNSRDGLIPGEGAGMLVIETLEHAQARGANILGEIVGYGQTTDAYHVTAPAEGGLGAARAIKQALREAGLTPSEVDYINAHGTGTWLNDSSETAAIKNAYGEAAYDLAVSSTKSMTGHVMGGTGAIESVICTLAIRDSKVPPTINLVQPAEDCDLDYIPNTARDLEVNVAANHAFGFGGHNAVLIFKKFEA